jgi:hypothetical protein
VIPLSAQLEMFKEYIGKLKGIVGEKRTNFILANSLFLVVGGSDDIANTYYVVHARLQYDIPAYTDLMSNSAIHFVKVRNLVLYIYIYVNVVVHTYISKTNYYLWFHIFLNKMDIYI